MSGRPIKSRLGNLVNHESLAFVCDPQVNNLLQLGFRLGVSCITLHMQHVVEKGKWGYRYLKVEAT